MTCPKFHTPLVTHLDRLLNKILHDDPPSLPDEWHKIYGLASLPSSSRPPLVIYINSTCNDAGRPSTAAGLGVFFRDGNVLNSSKRVVGDQSNSRAHLYALLLALQLASANRALHIHSSSEYLINSLTYWAPCHAKTGWACANSDLLSAIALWIASRPAPVKLFKVKSHSISLHLNKVSL
ncbi:hypothetical protein D9758_014049 [Tetrapyrgos nigripes]|uniref:RNase H type-1 domain-containing protein n=1 Tax=Tetrapyrgos nigripes TaxID=182062 RepID=A0A8H5CHX5_9AGAR|nr:hypothetical protein D9758_014049 [Tetrapyrgos nigripes]